MEGEEPAVVEIEYVLTDELQDLENWEEAVQGLLPKLQSKDWVENCSGLVHLRQLLKSHKQQIAEKLPETLEPILKAVKNPRSALCKTGLMAVGDVFRFVGDDVLPHLDKLLVPLLSRATQDKKFVCEEAANALVSLATYLSADGVLKAVIPYTSHKNPKFRAKATTCVYNCTSHLDVKVVKERWLDALLKVVASQVSDQLPESREAARKLAVLLRETYAADTKQDTDSSDSDDESWESFCKATLNNSHANAVLRVTVQAAS